MLNFTRHRLLRAWKAWMCYLLIGHLGQSASGQGLFANVSEAAGVNADGLHHAVAIGDFDRDGREDIYVGTKFAPNRLFRNLGNMQFEEVAVPAGVADDGTTNAVLWADFNNDGWLDLYTGNYLDPNRLYLNNGDGTFTDATDAWNCLLYTSPSPRDKRQSRMPSSA